LAFWASGKPYSEMPIERTTAAKSHTIGKAYVNGKEIRVGFDTGAPLSFLTLAASTRAGVHLDSPGVVSDGYQSGIGGGFNKQWIGPFASFKIGDEEIRNTRLRIGVSGLGEVDMLIGADFFL